MAVNLFSSSVFFAIANASLCVSKCSFPESGSPKNVALVLVTGEVVNRDLFHRLGRMVTLR